MWQRWRTTVNCNSSRTTTEQRAAVFAFTEKLHRTASSSGTESFCWKTHTGRHCSTIISAANRKHGVHCIDTTCPGMPQATNIPQIHQRGTKPCFECRPSQRSRNKIYTRTAAMIHRLILHAFGCGITVAGRSITSTDADRYMHHHWSQTEQGTAVSQNRHRNVIIQWQTVSYGSTQAVSRKHVRNIVRRRRAGSGVVPTSTRTYRCAAWCCPCGSASASCTCRDPAPRSAGAECRCVLPSSRASPPPDQRSATAATDAPTN